MSKWICLTGYEFRKLFGSRAVLLLILALLAVNGYQIHQVQQERDVMLRNELYPQVYEEMHERYAGEITADKIAELLTIYRPLQEAVERRLGYADYDPDSYTGNVGSDEYFFARFFVDEMEYDYLYQNYAYGIVRRALTNMTFYEEKGNLYEYEKNARIAEDFYGRRIDTFAYTGMFFHYLPYDFSVLLVLIICLFGMAGVFVTEKETEMSMLLATSRNGGRKTAAAKLTASFLFCCLVCVLFWLEDFALFSAFFRSGWEAAASPLYALASFQNTPLRLTIGEFSLVMCVLKTLGVWGCCTLYLLLSSLCRSTLIPYIGGLCLTAALLYGQAGSLYDVRRKCFNPLELADGNGLFSRARYVNLLGQPVRMYWPVIGSVIIGSLLLCGLLLWGNRRRRPGGRRH